MNKNKSIYYITGASGVGKTTLVESLKKKYVNKNWSFLHSDSIGVPSFADMEREYGSVSAWQEAKTYEWINRLVNDYDNEKIFLEGQSDLQFILTGFQKNNFTNYKIILLDINEEEMVHRLSFKRGQPELITDDMKNWLKYLRKQADEMKIPVIDTSDLSEEEVLTEFEKEMNL